MRIGREQRTADEIEKFFTANIQVGVIHGIQKNRCGICGLVSEEGLRYDFGGKKVSAMRAKKIDFVGSDTKHLNATGRAFDLSRVRFGGRGLFTKKASYFTKLNHKLSFVTMIGL